MADASELGMAAPMITNPFEDMSVGLGDGGIAGGVYHAHGVFDDKFSFGEDPHTEFNQLDDVRTFRMWVRETVSAVLGRAEASGEGLPSCELRPLRLRLGIAGWSCSGAASQRASF